MYQRSDRIGIMLLVLAAGLLFIGSRLNLPILTGLGGVCIGLFALVAGFAAILTRRLGFETRQKNFGPISTYTGLTAILWGALFLLFALVVFIFVGVYWFSPGGIPALWADLLGKPLGWGIILLCIGIWVTVSGVIRLMAGSAGYYKGAADRVLRLSGVLPFFFGLGLLGIGMLLVFLPGIFVPFLKGAWTAVLQSLFH